MGLYVFIEAIVGVVAGGLLAACSKKAEGVTYGKLDKAGRIINIALILAYLCMSPMCLFIGLLCRPKYGGFLGILGWIIAIISSSVLLFCGLGLGTSVVLRKKGKSKPSFAVQFAGVAAFLLMIFLFVISYDSLMIPLN